MHRRKESSFNVNMETKVATLNTNWLVKRGDLAKAVQTQINHEDIFIKPDADEFCSHESALLLMRPSQSTDPCELHITVVPAMKIESFSMVNTVEKLEIFVGPQQEYCETVYAAIAEQDETDSEEPMDDEMPVLYRLDVEITKSGISELVLKLPTSQEEICIFGLLLQIAPNPKGVTTQTPNKINLENVAKMLAGSNKKLSANAEKCKLLMEMHKQPGVRDPQKFSGFLGLLMERNSAPSVADPATNPSTSPGPLYTSSHPPSASCGPKQDFTTDVNLETYLSFRLQDMEQKLNARIDEMEAKLETKLNRILALLEAQSK